MSVDKPLVFRSSARIFEDQYTPVVLEDKTPPSVWQHEISWSLTPFTAVGKLSRPQKLFDIVKNKPQPAKKRKTEKTESPEDELARSLQEALDLQDRELDYLDCEGDAENPLTQDEVARLTELATTNPKQLERQLDLAAADNPGNVQTVDELLVVAAGVCDGSLEATESPDDADQEEKALLDLWVKEHDAGMAAILFRNNTSHLPLGGTRGGNMSLVQYDGDVVYVHWKSHAQMMGQIVRSPLNRFVTVVPLMNPIKPFLGATIVLNDVGERGDRRMPRDIRIAAPVVSTKMQNMWLAGMDSTAYRHCNYCLILDAKAWRCSVCLLNWHTACAEAVLPRLQRRLNVPTPRPAPDWPSSFLVCSLCKSRWC